MNRQRRAAVELAMPSARRGGFLRSRMAFSLLGMLAYHFLEAIEVASREQKEL